MNKLTTLQEKARAEFGNDLTQHVRGMSYTEFDEQVRVIWNAAITEAIGSLPSYNDAHTHSNEDCEACAKTLAIWETRTRLEALLKV